MPAGLRRGNGVSPMLPVRGCGCCREPCRGVLGWEVPCWGVAGESGQKAEGSLPGQGSTCQRRRFWSWQGAAGEQWWWRQLDLQGCRSAPGLAVKLLTPVPSPSESSPLKMWIFFCLIRHLMQEKVSAGPPPSLVWLGASHKIGMYPAELGCALREGKKLHRGGNASRKMASSWRKWWQRRRGSYLLCIFWALVSQRRFPYFYFSMQKRRDLGDKGNRTCFCGVSHPLLG